MTDMFHRLTDILLADREIRRRARAQKRRRAFRGGDIHVGDMRRDVVSVDAGMMMQI